MSEEAFLTIITLVLGIVGRILFVGARQANQDEDQDWSHHDDDAAEGDHEVADQVAREAGNKAADATYEWLKKPENRDALKTGAIVALGRLRALASPIAAILAGAWAGWKIGSYNSAVREQGAQNYASSQIALVTKLAKRALTIKEATLLRDFHADQFRKAYDAKLREERSK